MTPQESRALADRAAECLGWTKLPNGDWRKPNGRTICQNRFMPAFILDDAYQVAEVVIGKGGAVSMVGWPDSCHAMINIGGEVTSREGKNLPAILTEACVEAIRKTDPRATSED